MANNSDYSKKRTNLNNLIPNVNKSKILESLNENLFNRYLTKSELTRFIGNIGDEDTSSVASYTISEPTEYRTVNQLQPVAQLKTGSVDSYMTFEQFVNKLEAVGVDISSLDRWGALLEFNWVPPIDLDKLMNYRDYFWTRPEIDVDYITIKNYSQFSNARFNQAQESVFDAVQSYDAYYSTSLPNDIGYVEVSGDVTSKFLIDDNILLNVEVSDGLSSGFVRKVSNVFYNSGSRRTTISFTELVQGTIKRVCNPKLLIITNGINTTESTITVNGNVTDLFCPGYVFSIYDDNDILLKCVSSSFNSDPASLRTTIIVEGLPTVLNNQVEFINLLPAIFLLKGEKEFFTPDNITIADNTEWLLNDIEKIWFKNSLILDTISTGELLPATKTLSDNSQDFITSGVIAGDYVIMLDGLHAGMYEISSVFDTQLVLVSDKRFLSASAINYKIVRKENILSKSQIASTNSIYYDSVNDNLLQYAGIAWEIVLTNVSYIVDLTNGKHLIDISQNDDWNTNNYWQHKDQVSDTTDKSRAQIPIIEFDAFIELSDTSYASHEWDYRSSSASTYLTTDVQPDLLELHDIVLTSDNDEFEFEDYYTISFHEKYGNLTPSLPNSSIKLIDFVENSGTYAIDFCEFTKNSITGRYVTKIHLLDALSDTNDRPIGGRIGPSKTSVGDDWLGYGENHWRFKGIKQITASSYNWTPNPMINDFVRYSSTGNYYSNLYLTSQEFNIKTDAVGATIELDSSLQEMVLYDDYQEGDIRVYINGVRQYANFTDNGSILNSDYVGGITFNNTVTLTTNDIVRIEVGEAFLEDIGRRDVLIYTPTGYEKYNLTRLRKIEQHRFTRNSYPIFKIFNCDGSPSDIASEIFKYAESSDMPVSPYTFRRIVFDYIKRGFTFENLLQSEDQPLYAYNNLLNDRLETVWKHGTNLEKPLPVQLSGQWDIINPWYYNIEHKNKKVVTGGEILRHVTSLISSQETSVLFGKNNSKYYLLDNVNHILGGTIKEHNGGLDSLVSALFINGGSPINVIDFAANSYNSSVNYIKEIFKNNIHEEILSTANNTLVDLNDNTILNCIDEFENNDKYVEWFGDSTNTSIKNFITSTAGLGIFNKTYPHKFKNVSGNYVIVHHDGHHSTISFLNAEREAIIKKLSPQYQTVDLTSDPFPIVASVGQILVRTDLQALTREIYKSSNTLTWFKVDIDLLLANLILDIELKLYNDCLEYEYRYNFDALNSLDRYDEFSKDRFYNFVNVNNISNPLKNSTVFNSNDPFTWNYAYTSIPEHPVTNLEDSATFGCWQALYEYVYGTAYPNNQPWVLQGYSDKPVWWDDAYVNTDLSVNRYWKVVMWTNILSGIVPSGYPLPNGETSNGSSQIDITFDFLPINIDGVATNDGYAPDSLLPPYWNSANTSNTNIRTLFDINLNQGVTTPNLDFEFGQMGTVEWLWGKSIWKNYDDLIIGFKLDPIELFNAVFDSTFCNIACLQIDKKLKKVRNHRETVFHGELIDNELYVAHGINQWYAFFIRYTSIDGEVSAFNTIWKTWEHKLAYLFGGMIDTDNLSVFNYNFDITDKDYTVNINKTKSFDSKEMAGLQATLLSVPSKFSKTRDNGIGWTVELDSLTPVKSVSLYDPECFDFYVDVLNNICDVGRYPLQAASITVPRGYQIVDYNQQLTNSKNTNLSNTTFSYYASIEFDNLNTVSLIIKGHNAQTVEDLLAQINDKISAYGEAVLEYGNIKILSNTIGGATAVNITDAGLFTSVSDFFVVHSSGVSSYTFNKIFEVYGNVTRIFSPRSTFTVANSSNYNGQYTVLNSVYDVTAQTTKIFILESINIPDGDIDGYLISDSTKTLPESWITGTEVFLDSSSVLPSPLDLFTPYYVIRLDDYSFKLAKNASAAKLNNAITLQTVGNGIHSVGRLKRTFTALSGSNTTYPWRVYEDDKRVTRVENFPIEISGIQNVVNFVKGYESFLYDDGIDFKNIDGDNADSDTGRTNDWQLHIEKFINWAYQVKSIKQENKLKLKCSVNLSDNTLELNNSTVGWANGTAIIFLKDSNAQLPEPFDNPLSEYIPYYIIRNTSNNKFQVAVSKHDALKGKAIPITSVGSGSFYVQTYTSIINYPTFDINPAKHMVWVGHELGIISDIFHRTDYYFTETPKIYDQDGNILNIDSILMYRQDKETKISLLKDIINNNEKYFEYIKRQNVNGTEQVSVVINQNIKNISGFKLLLDSYEHILTFNNISVDGSMIFDSFLGIRTPRFYLEFSKSDKYTLRPNLGGYVLQDGKLVDNIENSVENIRFLYDTYKIVENKPIVERARKSIGYDGPRDYMDDLQINDKTQFAFWRGMIQNKGTNNAIKAFINQPIFEDAYVDEFWAYRLGCFGDNKEKIYPELKMFTRDVSTKEMRVEFVTPDNTSLDETFEAIRLTDLSRWWNQPDQLFSLKPKSSFYFDSQVINIMNNVENDIVSVNGRLILRLPVHADKVIISYWDSVAEETKQLSEGYEYTFINGKVLEMNSIAGNDPRSIDSLSVYILSYNYDAQNPATLIDKQAGAVITRVPIWNPALGQHYHVANSIIDIRNDTDVAVYNYENTTQTETTWLTNKVGKVWLDTSKMAYIPYYDSRIFTDINERILKWGTMADWASILLYEWTESLVAPSEWDATVLKDAKNSNLLQDEKRSGNAFYKLYKNTQEDLELEPVWVEHVDVVEDFVVSLVEPDTEPTNAAITGVVNTYINGVYAGTLDLDSDTISEFCYGDILDNQLAKPRPQDILTLIKVAEIPTATQLEEQTQFKKVYPYSVITKIDPVSKASYGVYYFWVTNKTNKISITGDTKINMQEAAKQLRDIPIPYMILQGPRTPEFGYGLIYGTVFDEDTYELPHRYTQLVVKGLENTVKDDERYSLRFMRDFTLRDNLPGPNSLYTPLYLKNVHWEWKLIREKQLFKIDSFLWDRITESLIGKRVISGAVYLTPAPDEQEVVIPTINRVIYDQLYDTDTRFGLGEEQTFIDKDLGLSIITSLLVNNTLNFKNVDINEFVKNYNMEDQASLVSMMYDIYNNFTIDEVNAIFFEFLHAAMSLKKEHADIFKTSWVALQATQNVRIPSNGILRSPSFVEGECPFTPEPTPTPTPEPTATPEPTPTPTPTISVTPTVTPTITPDYGDLLISGSFSQFNIIDETYDTQYNLAKLDYDGELDQSFTPVIDSSESVMVMQSDMKIVMAGYHTTYNGNPVNSVIRINPDGSLDETFICSLTDVVDLKMLPNQQILAACNTDFSVYRLNVDGSIDNTFTSYPFSSTITEILPLDSGKIMVVGEFTYTTIEATQVIDIARLNSDGTFDDTFESPFDGTIFSGFLRKIKPLTDGSHLVVGTLYPNLEEITQVYAAIIPNDGVTYTSLPFGSGSECYDCDVQSDGKMIIVGAFSEFDSLSVNKIIRLDTNGNRDFSFTSPDITGIIQPSSILILPDDAIIIWGTHDGD